MYDVAKLQQWVEQSKIKLFLMQPSVAKSFFFITLAGFGLSLFTELRNYWHLVNQPALPAWSAKKIIPHTQLPNALKKNLFGVYVPMQLDANQIKRSTLDVSIKGIVYSTNPADSEVIIKPVVGREKAYHEGDEISEDAKIERITSTGIVIEHDGVLEQLTLPKYKE